MLLDPEIQSVYDAFPQPARAIFDRIVAIAILADPALQNRLQWQKPTFTLNNNWHHWLFSVANTKKGVTVTFHKGWLLEDPYHALQGDGLHVRMLRFNESAEVNADILTGLIRSAIAHQLDM
jgi:hypothetical protein